MLKITNKLVRDNIPDIISRKGGRAKIKILEDKEYQKELIKKLKEETKEFEEDNNKEELADIYEVFIAILKTADTNIEEISHIAEIKRKKNGAFKNRIYMEYYDDGSCLR